MNVLLISGGSGGHLVPAMALAEHLQPADRCFMMSTRRPVDQILSADGGSGLQWETVGLQPFTPARRWLSPKYLARQWEAVGQIRSVIGMAKPEVVVGFGGYLSAVGVVEARRAGIPSVIHEQNFVPGQANRLLAHLADAVAVSFSETGRYLPKKTPVEMTGNPLRIKAGGSTLEKARAEFGFDARRPLLLVMGGSQGSRAVNRLAMEMWQDAPRELRESAQVLHLAGTQEAAEVEQSYRNVDGLKVVVVPFLRRMDLALTAATLSVSRAGATGIAEMTAFAVPSILIPYPYAGAHQRANAEWAQNAGGAVLLDEAGLTAARLGLEVKGLLADPARLEQMRQALRSHSGGNAVQRLGDLVRKVAGKL